MNSAQVKILVDTVQQLSLARNIETITEVVRHAARNLTGADGATFVLRDNDLCYYVDEDAISPLWKGQRFKMDSCISGWTMLNSQPAVVEDIYFDYRIAHEAYRPTFVKSLVMVPIRRTAPVGAIGNYWAAQHKTTEEELMLLQSLADITSVSIENVLVYNEMEQRVKQRTGELEQAFTELESFAYSVSHDLRAPLRTITSRLEFLINHYTGKPLDETGNKLIASALGTATSMRKLIDELLQFSKLGKAQLVTATLPMQRIAQEVCNQLREQEGHRDIELQIQALPDAAGDALLIGQVWHNLISNAIKYTAKKPKAQIAIGVEQTNDGPAYFVKDNGDGFDMEYYPKLFGIFQRLHDNSEFDGHGIGLALTQRIVQRHGGKIWASAQPGQGAQFYFSLPG
jgi:hypothetical protein